MLARPLTASKRKAGVSDDSVLGVRESWTWFAFVSSSPTDDGLGVGKEDTPIRQQASQSSLQEESFILGGSQWEGWVGLRFALAGGEEAANIHTSYMLLILLKTIFQCIFLNFPHLTFLVLF